MLTYFNRLSREFHVYYYDILNAMLIIIILTVYFYWYVNYFKKNIFAMLEYISIYHSVLSKRLLKTF